MPEFVIEDREHEAQAMLAELNNRYEHRAEHDMPFGPDSLLRLECARLSAVADRIDASLALSPMDADIPPRMLILMRNIKEVLAEEGGFSLLVIAGGIEELVKELYPGLSWLARREVVQEACTRLVEHPYGQVQQHLLTHPELEQFPYRYEFDTPPDLVPPPRWRVPMPRWLLWRKAAQVLAVRRPDTFTVAVMAQWLAADSWVTPPDFEARIVWALEILRSSHEGGYVIRQGRKSDCYRYMVDGARPVSASPKSVAADSGQSVCGHSPAW